MLKKGAGEKIRSEQSLKKAVKRIHSSAGFKERNGKRSLFQQKALKKENARPVIYVFFSSPQYGENTVFFSNFPVGGFRGILMVLPLKFRERLCHRKRLIRYFLKFQRSNQ